MQSPLYCGSNLFSNCPFLHLHTLCSLVGGLLLLWDVRPVLIVSFAWRPFPSSSDESHHPHPWRLRYDPCPHPLWVSSFDPSPPQMEWTSSLSTYPTLYVSRNDIVYKYLCYAHQTESSDESKLCCFHLCVLRAQHNFWHIVGLPFMFRDFEQNRQ